MQGGVQWASTVERPDGGVLRHSAPVVAHDPNDARKRAKKTAAAEAPPGHRKRRLAYMDGGDGRGRELRRMIQMGPAGIKAIEGRGMAV